LHKKDTIVLKQVEIKLSKIIDKTIIKSKIYTIKQSIKKIALENAIKTSFKDVT